MMPAGVQRMSRCRPGPPRREAWASERRQGRLGVVGGLEAGAEAAGEGPHAWPGPDAGAWGWGRAGVGTTWHGAALQAAVYAWV